MKKTTIFCLVLLNCMSLIIDAQPAYFKWAISAGAIGQDGCFDVTVDPQGNVISVGYFTGIVDFDPGPGTATLVTLATASTNVFVLKVDSLSNFLWVKTVTSTGGVVLVAVTNDAAGNIYLCGRFRGLMDADPGPGTYTMFATAGTVDAFVTKWSSAGNLIWAKQFGGNSDDEARGIVVDNAGNIYTTGLFRAAADFDPGSATYSLSSNGVQDIYVSKLDPLGNFLWAKSIGGTSIDESNGIALHPSGDIVICGDFMGICDFDPGPGVSTLTMNINLSQAFVWRLNAAGNFMWAKQLNTMSGFSDGQSVVVDPSGNIYTIGRYSSLSSGTTDFDPGPGTYTVSGIPTSIYSAFVLKLDDNGFFIWARTYGGNAYNEPWRIEQDAAENIYIVGTASQGTVDLDPGPGQVIYTNVAGAGGYILELSNQGNYEWSHMFGPGLANARSIYIDQQAMIYLAGGFGDLVDFDPGITTYTKQAALNGGDAFVLKLRLTCLANTPVDVTPVPSKNICLGDATVLSASGTGNIHWYSTSSSSLIISSGPNYSITPTSVGTKTYFAGISTCVQSQTRAAVVVTVNACVGIEHKDQIKELSIFPNPANQYVTINSENYGEISKADLFDNTGRLLKTYLTFESENKIDLCEMSTGLYFLTIYFQNGEKCSKKIMVAH